MVTHEIKCLPSDFKDLMEGLKTSERVRTSPTFQVGDFLKFREWLPAGYFPDTPSTGKYTGNFKFKTISHIRMGVEFSTLFFPVFELDLDVRTEDNGMNAPAFPVSRNLDDSFQEGMTLLDYFAAKAMQAFIAPGQGMTLFAAQELADKSYTVAKYMIEKKGNGSTNGR